MKEFEAIVDFYCCRVEICDEATTLGSLVHTASRGLDGRLLRECNDSSFDLTSVESTPGLGLLLINYYHSRLTYLRPAVIS
jgi:hypothetical protein